MITRTTNKNKIQRRITDRWNSAHRRSLGTNNRIRNLQPRCLFCLGLIVLFSIIPVVGSSVEDSHRQGQQHRRHHHHHHRHGGPHHDHHHHHDHQHHHQFHKDHMQIDCEHGLVMDGKDHAEEGHLDDVRGPMIPLHVDGNTRTFQMSAHRDATPATEEVGVMHLRGIIPTRITSRRQDEVGDEVASRRLKNKNKKKKKSKHNNMQKNKNKNKKGKNNRTVRLSKQEKRKQEKARRTHRMEKKKQKILKQQKQMVLQKQRKQRKAKLRKQKVQEEKKKKEQQNELEQQTQEQGQQEEEGPTELSDGKPREETGQYPLATTQASATPRPSKGSSGGVMKTKTKRTQIPTAISGASVNADGNTSSKSSKGNAGGIDETSNLRRTQIPTAIRGASVTVDNGSPSKGSSSGSSSKGSSSKSRTNAPTTVGQVIDEDDMGQGAAVGAATESTTTSTDGSTDEGALPPTSAPTTVEVIGGASLTTDSPLLSEATEAPVDSGTVTGATNPVQGEGPGATAPTDAEAPAGSDNVTGATNPVQDEGPGATASTGDDTDQGIATGTEGGVGMPVQGSDSGGGVGISVSDSNQSVPNAGSTATSDSDSTSTANGPQGDYTPTWQESNSILPAEASKTTVVAALLSAVLIIMV